MKWNTSSQTFQTTVCESRWLPAPTASNFCHDTWWELSPHLSKLPICLCWDTMCVLNNIQPCSTPLRYLRISPNLYDFCRNCPKATDSTKSLDPHVYSTRRSSTYNFSPMNLWRDMKHERHGTVASRNLFLNSWTRCEIEETHINTWQCHWERLWQPEQEQKMLFLKKNLHGSRACNAWSFYVFANLYLWSIFGCRRVEAGQAPSLLEALRCQWTPWNLQIVSAPGPLGEHWNGDIGNRWKCNKYGWEFN